MRLSRKVFAAAAIGLISLCGLYALSDFPSTSNPECDGHTMNYWLKRTDYVPTINLNMHGDGGWPQRETAFNTLAKIGAPAVPALTKILLNKDIKPDRRWKCAETIGAIGPPARSAAGALAAALTDRTFPEGQRYEIVVAINKIGASGEQAPTLINYLKDRHVQRPMSDSLSLDLAQLFAIKALKNAGEAARPGVPLLVEMLHDYQKAALDRDINLKSKLEKEHAVESDETIRAAIVETLGVLAAIDPQAIQAMEDAVLDSSGKVRVRAAVACIKVGRNTTAMPILEVLSTDENVVLRWEVVEALELLGATKADLALPLLRKMLGDSNDETRWRAAAALGNLGRAAEPAISDLQKLLNDKSGRVKEDAQEAIGKIESGK